MSRAGLLWVFGLAVPLLLVAVLNAIPLDWSNSRTQQAAIAALMVASGWFAGFMLREISQQIGRTERLRDLHRALYSEIQHNLDNLGSEDDLKAHAEKMLARMEEGDGFVPFIPRERNDTVFQAVVGDLHILPRTSIDPVVRYYSQLAALDAMVEDMRGETFKEMSPRRRGEIYSDYIALRMRLVEFGTDGNTRITEYDRSRKGWL